MPNSTVPSNRPERFLRTSAVCARFGGVCPSTVWRWVQKGWFPKPIRLHPTSRINVWPESQIEALQASRQQGEGYRPNAAIAERARRNANRKAGKTPIGGFKRGPNAGKRTLTRTKHFTRRAP